MPVRVYLLNRLCWLLYLFALAGFYTGCSDGPPECQDDSLSAECSAAKNKTSGPGDFATDYLQDVTYTSLLIEIDYVEGYPPQNAALQRFLSTVIQLLNKPDGVTITVDTEIPNQGNPAYTTEMITDLEDRYRTHYSSVKDTLKEAVFYLLYLDGQSIKDEGNQKVIGISYRGSSIAMFKDTIVDISTLLAPPGLIEQATLEHEFGHIIGLVNKGIEMVVAHEDPDHSGHDQNPDCLMYWQNNSSNVLSIIENGTIPSFDENCLKDIAHAGGKNLVSD